MMKPKPIPLQCLSSMHPHTLRLRSLWVPYIELGSGESPHGICDKADVGAPAGLRSVTLLLINTLLLI